MRKKKSWTRLYGYILGHVFHGHYAINRHGIRCLGCDEYKSWEYFA